VRSHRLGFAPLARVAALALIVVALGLASCGALWWLWTEAACVATLHRPFLLSLAHARVAMWRALGHGELSDPALAFPTAGERQDAPPAWGYIASSLAASIITAWLLRTGWRAARGWQAASPLAHEPRTLAGRAVRHGWVGQRTWAESRDLHRLWVSGPIDGRPYLGRMGRRGGGMLAAEPEIQPMVVAPPRAGKSSGFVVPWLLDHQGPALVLSTKRDVYEATLARRAALGECWVYDPFGDPESAAFTPLVPAVSWEGAIRTGEALASAAHPDQANAANEFWDKEAASMLAPLLHAAALTDAGIARLIHWLDTRVFAEAIAALKRSGADAAADQLEGVERRDERNRETTVMSALSLLRAYRYPQLMRPSAPMLSAEGLLDARANTIYVVAAGHQQDALRPVILALVSSVYEAAVARARAQGPLAPRLFILMDEAANIAPVRNLASWLSQCGDHGIVIATIWQSIAQIEERYGRPARDAICAACTAQLFIPPLADPATSGYLTGLLGEEPVAKASGGRGMSVTHSSSAPAPWLRQMGRGRAILIYRDLPPAIVRAPGWFEDPRFTGYRASSSVRPLRPRS
jgi:type IV secretion system protein VirD4